MVPSQVSSFEECSGFVYFYRSASKATLSRWLVEDIKSAGSDALSSTLPRAHDTRLLSTSWALFNGASIEQIQKVTFWLISNLFISCYLRDVIALEAAFGTASLCALSSGSSRVLTILVRYRPANSLWLHLPPPYLWFVGSVPVSTHKVLTNRWARIMSMKV